MSKLFNRQSNELVVADPRVPQSERLHAYELLTRTISQICYKLQSQHPNSYNLLAYISSGEIVDSRTGMGEDFDLRQLTGFMNRYYPQIELSCIDIACLKMLHRFASLAIEHKRYLESVEHLFLKGPKAVEAEIERLDPGMDIVRMLLDTTREVKATAEV